MTHWVDVRVERAVVLTALRALRRRFGETEYLTDLRPPASGPEVELRLRTHHGETELVEQLRESGIVVLASRTRPDTGVAVTI